jgi:hypothetical protein
MLLGPRAISCRYGRHASLKSAGPVTETRKARGRCGAPGTAGGGGSHGRSRRAQNDPARRVAAKSDAAEPVGPAQGGAAD